jgi:flagellar basal body-associated protein FliL
MSDEEKFLEDDVTAEAEEEQREKTGFLPGIVIQILKWFVIGLVFILLTGTIAWAVYTLFFSKGRTSTGLPEDFSPDRTELTKPLEYFSTELNDIRGQTNDEPPALWYASIRIGYEKGNSRILAELIEKKEWIRNEIAKLFGRKAENDLRTKNWLSIENEIKSMLNMSIVQTGLIEDVRIYELNVVPQ